MKFPTITGIALMAACTTPAPICDRDAQSYDKFGTPEDVCEAPPVAARERHSIRRGIDHPPVSVEVPDFNPVDLPQPDKEPEPAPAPEPEPDPMPEPAPEPQPPAKPKPPQEPDCKGCQPPPDCKGCG